MKQQVRYELLDRVQMHAADRAAAEATLARAEAIASAVYRATQAVQAAVEFLRRGAQTLAQRIRARFA
jgi:hypothetical protein